jgi:hypothetical protein
VTRLAPGYIQHQQDRRQERHDQVDIEDWPGVSRAEILVPDHVACVHQTGAQVQQRRRERWREQVRAIGANAIVEDVPHDLFGACPK